MIASDAIGQTHGVFGHYFRGVHGDPTPQAITPEQRKAARAKRRAQRAARKRNRS